MIAAAGAAHAATPHVSLHGVSLYEFVQSASEEGGRDPSTPSWSAYCRPAACGRF